MRKAYDTFLQSEVSADLAAKAGSFEPYRYECAHCGEEVRLAAVGSINMVPHFRHRNGNSDVECELYLGQYGSISTDAHSRKSKNERAEFYFDSTIKMFYLGLRFSNDEINAYEHLGTTFELRATTNAMPFFSLHINSKNFEPDVQRLIPLERFSYNYYLSNTLNKIKRPYEVFKNSGNVPSIFKLQINDSRYKAKLVRSSILYTNVTYLVVYQRQHWCSVDRRLPSEVNVDDSFEFETMGRRFLGKVLTIKSKTAQVDSLLMSWGYQLETSETLTLLWPPAVMTDEAMIINTNYAYLYSTFELQPHGNINVRSQNIKRDINGVYMVTVDSRTKIYKKNAELVINKFVQAMDNYDCLPFAKEISNSYFVPNDGLCFIFNRSGAVPLHKGMSVILTPKSEIRHYVSGYLDCLVIPPEHSKIPSELLLRDTLANYKRNEKFIWEDFASLELSQIAIRYIDICKDLGVVNSAVKHLIQEGRL